VTLYFSDIGQTTNRKAEKLSIEGASNGFANTSFADSGRTNKANDFTFNSSSKFAYRQKF
jgi:hypothetical protein